MYKDEEILYGGNVNQVIHIGNTVHRTTDWNPLVHELLRHLELQGFNGAPKYIEIDEKGREVLSFIPGEVPGNDYPNFKPYIWSENTLVEVAKLLKNYHDATQGFLSSALKAKWHNPYIDSQQYEVICHNDAALYNIVFRNELPVAFIDFDIASPGTRIWDIAYALYTAVPLSSFAPEYHSGAIVPYVPELHASDRRHRISLFFESYGIAAPKDIKEWVIKRIDAMCDILKVGSEQGNAAYKKMIDEGHLAHYESEIVFLQEHFWDWE